MAGTQVAIPAVLPDEATLSRLAAEIFAAWPGAAERAAATVQAQSTDEARAPTGDAVDSASTASLTAGEPTPAAAAAVPGAAEVPTSYASALPQVGALSGPAFGAGALPASPFYFVSEAISQSSPPGLQEAKRAAENRITPRASGMPGEQDLQQILDSLVADGRLRKDPAGAQPYGAFYFLDGAPAANGVPTPIGDSAHPAFDVRTIRRDFPILAERVNGKPLIWLDNAATTQKPQSVIDRLVYFYAHENSNIHRAAHELAARATDAYEAARDKVARFLGASSAEEIIFVRGATEGINLVAQSFGRQEVRAGDEIVVSQLEHHANIVPWQQLAAEVGATLRVIPVDDRGELRLDEYQRLLGPKTRLVAFAQVSNALGTVTPVREIVELAHRAGARVLVDGAQAVSHMRVNVQALDADFYVFSGHKVFGPTGIGAVYGKRELLEAMPPWQGGGNMIADVTFEKTIYQEPPAKFEAGTGNIADAAGLGAALDYLERVGIENVARYEHDLLVYATHAMQTVPGLRLIGTARNKASVLSFVLEGYRVEEVGEALSREGIAVRAGHHCAQPILRRFGLEATVRPSLAFYNTCEEVDAMVAVLHQLAQGKGRMANL